MASGIRANTDHFNLTVSKDDVRLHASFCSDGLFIYDGANFTEVGTNIVTIGVWQKWTFDCDFSTSASAVCDIYLNNVLVGADVDCSQTGSFTNGEVGLTQYGWTTASRISYVDYFKVGDDGTFTDVG